MGCIQHNRTIKIKNTHLNKSKSDINIISNHYNKYVTMFGHNKLDYSRTMYYLKRMMGNDYEKMFFNSKNTSPIAKNNNNENIIIEHVNMNPEENKMYNEKMILDYQKGYLKDQTKKFYSNNELSYNNYCKFKINRNNLAKDKIEINEVKPGGAGGGYKNEDMQIIQEENFNLKEKQPPMDEKIIINGEKNRNIKNEKIDIMVNNDNNKSRNSNKDNNISKNNGSKEMKISLKKDKKRKDKKKMKENIINKKIVKNNQEDEGEKSLESIEKALMDKKEEKKEEEKKMELDKKNEILNEKNIKIKNKNESVEVKEDELNKKDNFENNSKEEGNISKNGKLVEYKKYTEEELKKINVLEGLDSDEIMQ